MLQIPPSCNVVPYMEAVAESNFWPGADRDCCHIAE